MTVCWVSAMGADGSTVKKAGLRFRGTALGGMVAIAVVFAFPGIGIVPLELGPSPSLLSNGTITVPGMRIRCNTGDNRNESQIQTQTQTQILIQIQIQIQRQIQIQCQGHRQGQGQIQEQGQGQNDTGTYGGGIGVGVSPLTLGVIVLFGFWAALCKHYEANHNNGPFNYDGFVAALTPPIVTVHGSRVMGGPDLRAIVLTRIFATLIGIVVAAATAVVLLPNKAQPLLHHQASRVLRGFQGAFDFMCKMHPNDHSHSNKKEEGEEEEEEEEEAQRLLLRASAFSDSRVACVYETALCRAFFYTQPRSCAACCTLKINRRALFNCKGPTVVRNKKQGHFFSKFRNCPPDDESGKSKRMARSSFIVRIHVGDRRPCRRLRLATRQIAALAGTGTRRQCHYISRRISICSCSKRNLTRAIRV